MAAILLLRQSQSVLALEEARLLSWLKDSPARDSLGFSCFADLSRELLFTAPRTAQERIAVYQVCELAPAVKQALLEGALSLCQVLVLGPLVRRLAARGRPGDAVDDPLDPESPPSLAWDESLLEWLRAFGRVSVVRMQSLVKERLASLEFAEPGAPRTRTAGDEVLEAPFKTVTFQAPPILAVAWEHSIELARRVLGYQAPLHECVEAILIEAAPEAIGRVRPRRQVKAPGSSGRVASGKNAAGSGGREAGSPVAGTGTGTAGTGTAEAGTAGTAEAGARALHSMAQVQQYLEDLDGLMESGDPRDPWDAVQRILQMQRLRRPGRVLLARLLRDLRDLRLASAERPGGSRPAIEQYCLDELHLSPRTARSLRREADLFDDCPELADAYCDGDLGLQQMTQIGRLVGAPVWARVSYRRKRSPFERFIRRATEVTRRQFERECRLLERLKETFPHLTVLRYGPLAGRRVEKDLLRELRACGWPQARVEKHLEERGLGFRETLGPVLYRKGRPHLSRDPAHNPLLMRRMEELLDLLVAVCAEAEAEDPVTVGGMQKNEPPLGLCRPGEEYEDTPTQRQTSARSLAAMGVRAEEDAISSGYAVEARQTSARPLPAPLSAQRPPSWPRPQPSWVRIRFSASEPVVQHWEAALELVREKCLPQSALRWPHSALLPTWAAVALLLDGAVSEWLRTDPESVPTEHKVINRDENRCQTPGCTRRSQLESHHVEHKSHGGSDRPFNRSTNCHGHHRMFHEGYVRVWGTAPGALHWEVGIRGASGKPVWRLLGEKFEEDEEGRPRP